MGSTKRRIKRNIIARRMAQQAGVIEQPIRYRKADGTMQVLGNSFTPQVFYRATMLRMLRMLRERMKVEHDKRQKTQPRKGMIHKLLDKFKKFREG